MYTSTQPDWIDIPGEPVEPINRKWGFWKMPTTIEKDDFFEIGMPDYLGTDLGAAGNAHYDHIVNYGGGGFFRGLQAASQVEDPNLALGKRWNAFRDQQKIAAESRRNLSLLDDPKAFPKALAKHALNQQLEGIDMAVNTWHPNNWDSYDKVAQAVTQKTGSAGAGQAVKTGLNATGKVLMTAAPLMDVLDFGLRVGEGQGITRAGVGTAGGMTGAAVGATVGAALTGPFAPVGAIVGGFAGSMLGDMGATKAYELVSEDAWEKTRKLQERGLNISLDQVKSLQSQGYNVNADSGDITRDGQTTSLFRASLSQPRQEGMNERRNPSNSISPHQSSYSPSQSDLNTARNIINDAQSSIHSRQQSSQDYIEASNKRFMEAVQRIKQSQSDYDFLKVEPLY